MDLLVRGPLTRSYRKHATQAHHVLKWFAHLVAEQFNRQRDRRIGGVVLRIGKTAGRTMQAGLDRPNAVWITEYQLLQALKERPVLFRKCGQFRFLRIR